MSQFPAASEKISIMLPQSEKREHPMRNSRTTKSLLNHQVSQQAIAETSFNSSDYNFEESSKVSILKD